MRLFKNTSIVYIHENYIITNTYQNFSAIILNPYITSITLIKNYLHFFFLFSFQKIELNVARRVKGCQDYSNN